MPILVLGLDNQRDELPAALGTVKVATAPAIAVIVLGIVAPVVAPAHLAIARL